LAPNGANVHGCSAEKSKRNKKGRLLFVFFVLFGNPAPRRACGDLPRSAGEVESNSESVGLAPNGANVHGCSAEKSKRNKKASFCLFVLFGNPAPRRACGDLPRSAGEVESNSESVGLAANGANVHGCSAEKSKRKKSFFLSFRSFRQPLSGACVR
jgi:hypothetical protein